MTYSIRVEYTSGDSFGSWDTSDTLEMTWEDQSVARANIQRIREHHQFCQANKRNWDDREGEREKRIAPFKGKDWVVTYHGEISEYSIILKTDDGKNWQIGVGWEGYFETLNAIEIVDNQELDRIEF